MQSYMEMTASINISMLDSWNESLWIHGHFIENSDGGLFKQK